MSDVTILIDKPEFARRLGSSVATIDRYRRRAREDPSFNFPPCAVLPSGVVRWRSSDVETWISERFQQAVA